MGYVANPAQSSSATINGAFADITASAVTGTTSETTAKTYTVTPVNAKMWRLTIWFTLSGASSTGTLRIKLGDGATVNTMYSYAYGTGVGELAHFSWLQFGVKDSATLTAWNSTGLIVDNGTLGSAIATKGTLGSSQTWADMDTITITFQNTSASVIATIRHVHIEEVSA